MKLQFSSQFLSYFRLIWIARNIQAAGFGLIDTFGIIKIPILFQDRVESVIFAFEQEQSDHGICRRPATPAMARVVGRRLLPVAEDHRKSKGKTRINTKLDFGLLAEHANVKL